MREIVRGVITNLDDFVELDKPSGLAFDTKVLILPIEDGKVGDFERRHLEWVRWVINDLHEQGDKYTHLAHKAAEVHEELYAALSRLFEEVESED